MKLKKGIVVATVVVVALAVTAFVIAKNRKPKVAPLNVTQAGLAVKGYDVVAYFTDAQAVPGSSQFAYEWQGAQWQFASAQHRDAFAQAPEKYAPQYGGYCAWAVGHNYTADADPMAWKIVRDKLYLNYNRKVQEKWEPEQERWIQAADANFAGLVQSK